MNNQDETTKVYMERDWAGNYQLWVIDGGEDNREADVYVQTDWDYPRLAELFGWSPCCGSGGTDGTVDCPTCGVTVTEHLLSAVECLDSHCDQITDVPNCYVDYLVGC